MKQVRQKSNRAAKEAGQKLTPVVDAEVIPPNLRTLPIQPPKRGRGRPRKNPLSTLDPLSDKTSADPKKLMKDMDAKALVVFRKAIADAEKASMTEAEYDGGGTKEDGHAVTKESLQRRVTRRLNVLDRFLTDDKLIELLACSSLKEIGIYEGIMLDKSLVLQGQPTVIIGNDDRTAMTNVLPRLMEELKRRGMVTNLKTTAIVHN